jgi:hypothetical protein
LVGHEEYVHEEVALDVSLDKSHEANDTHAFDGQSDDQDACEGSDVLAPRHDEIRTFGDLPLGVDMTSRKSCMGDDEPPMELRVTHSSSSQSPMLATTHEDISGIMDVVEEPCVVIEHKEHVDLQDQEERHDLETDDYIHTFQYGESESPLLGSPLIDQVVETDMSMGYLLPGPIYSDGDAFLVCRDSHITCMDTSVWDPSADDIGRMSAQEDTVVHTGYGAVQIEATVYDDVQWHTRGFSSTSDSGQCGTLALEECVDEHSIIDISNRSHEVALQQSSVQESLHLAGQLKVR